MIILSIFISFLIGIKAVEVPILLPFLLFILFKYKKDRKIIFIILIFFILGFLLYFLSRNLYHFGGNTQYFLIIKSRQNYVVAINLSGKYIINQQNNIYEIGDVIKVQGLIKTLENNAIESEFSFTNYLSSLGVYREFKVFKADTIISSFIKVKAFKTNLLSKYQGLSHDLVKAFIFNEREYASDFTITLKSLDLIFLFSTSGMHLNFLVKFSKKIVSLFSANEEVVETIGILIIIPLFIFNLDKFLFYRLFLLFILRKVNKKHLDNYFSNLEVVLFSAFILLFLNINLINQPSFYLSYLISLSIILGRSILYSENKIFEKLKIYGFIMLLLLPYRVNSSFQLSLFSYLLQPLLLPVLSVMFIVSYLSVLTFGGGVGIINNFGNFLYSIFKISDKYTITIPIGKISDFAVVIYFLLLVILVLSLQIKLKPVRNIIISSLLLFYMYQSLPIYESLIQSVTFINVGQGDATLIRKNNSTILIDTGGNIKKDIANDTLIPYFRKNKIFQLDAVIITHNDFDHNGALYPLIDNFKVKRVINTDVFPLTISGLTFYSHNNVANYSEENERSLVLSTNFIDYDWLFMGDASINNEKEIIKNYPNLQVDIVKLGHHGSNTSSSYEFLRHLDPDIAIISAGKNNSYGHPHPSVIKILTEMGIKIRRTDIEGTITISKLRIK